jgi:uncharacterized SAM-binding protein YcdF (DUF218 family)
MRRGRRLVERRLVGRRIVGRRIVLLLGTVGLMTVGLLMYAGYAVVAYASTPSTLEADVAIVLGAAVAYGEPTPVFRERIRHGIDLYQRGHVRALIFTGGVGFADERSEAEVARAYALAHGVPEADIACESRSRVTYGNLRGAQAVMVSRGYTTAVIVSDPLHMRRAMAMAEDVGIAAAPSPTPTTRYRTWRTKLGFLLRESRLYAGYLLRRLLMRLLGRGALAGA